MPHRIHLTNGKNKKKIVIRRKPLYETTTYDVTYCGHTFETFPGRFEHSVYLYSALEKLMELHPKSLCPQCMASEELGFDLLGDN
jgi:hypothetical protein